MDKHTAEYYQQLVGMKVVGVGEDLGEEEEFVCLIFKNEKGKKLLAWVLMDPEGNGPGHLDIVEE